MGQNNKKKNNSNRVSNIPQNFKQKDQINKVNGGVFVYTGDITVGELAKQLNVNSSDIIKKLFMNGTMVTINTTLSDDLIGQICLEFGYDFKKEKVVSEENFEELEIFDDEIGWVKKENPKFNLNPDFYRIKPEPKYRPFKSQKECWLEMHKHPDFGWVKDHNTGHLCQINCFSYVNIGIDCDDPISFRCAFDDYLFPDGAPFGIKEE